MAGSYPEPQYIYIPEQSVANEFSPQQWYVVAIGVVQLAIFGMFALSQMKNLLGGKEVKTSMLPWED